jgi:dephospho-CoA kinase
MRAGRPIIGIVGGIGSGKTYVANLFGEFGCLVIGSDEQVHKAYQSEGVKRTLRQWWGDKVFQADGRLDRSRVAEVVFSDPEQRRRLEALIHPLVAAAREQTMARHADDPQVVAWVWDTPLLYEAHLHGQCDAVVFVEAPLEARRQRVLESRGWSAEELALREGAQMALDGKRRLADHVIRNSAGPDEVRQQVKDVLSRVLSSRDGEGR